MKESLFRYLLCFFLTGLLTGCQTLKKENDSMAERDVLNQFVLEDFAFDSTPLADVLGYVQSEINKQSDNVWEIRMYETPSEITFSRLGLNKYSGTFRGQIGVGDFFLFLNETMNTKHEVEENVIYFSGRIDI